MTKASHETIPTDLLTDAAGEATTLDITVISPSNLERVRGGAGPSPTDVGSALGTAIEGTWKAPHAPDAPWWESVKNGINSFNENYNPIYWGLNRVKNYYTKPKRWQRWYPVHAANPAETISV